MKDKAASETDLSWIVPADQQGIRLDAFVRRCLPHLSERRARRAIGEGAFRINGRRGKKGDRLREGEAVEFHGAPQWLAAAPLPASRPDVVARYEDESVLVLDKPAEMATHGFSGRETQTLANVLAARCPSAQGVGQNRWQPGLVNRLDRGTSGLVLAAKNQRAFEDLRSQLRRGLVMKKYLTLVRGKPPERGVVDLPLAHDPSDRRKMGVADAAPARAKKAKAWRAVTRFRVIGRAQGFSLLEVEIETGVTHQIRAHLQAAGYPIVGDPLYSRGPDSLGLSRQFLHACFLGFRRPGDGREIFVESPLPEDLRIALESLGLQF